MTQNTLKATKDSHSKSAVPENKKRTGLVVFFLIAAVLCKAWYFDIGARVKAGTVLADIDTPEVDQQLAQAQAQLGVATAARDLAQVTYRRDQELLKTNVIAPQDFDTAASNYHSSEATVIVDQAIVNRLEALEDFKHVTAPFDGI